MSKKALLLINRYSRQGTKFLPLIVEHFYQHGLELIVKPIEKLEDYGNAVRKYHSNIDLVIVGGGDGTFNAVVDSLVETDLPLGILPLGTANDLARTLKIPFTIKQACNIITDGYLKSIDLGWVNGKYFFNVASIGLSVDITQKLSRGLKRRWGIFAYGITALQVVSNTHPFKATIIANNQEIKVKTVQVAIGNGRYYGGGMAIAQNAAIDDQKLDLYSIELKKWWQIFSLMWHLPRGVHNVFPWVRTLSAQEIEIHTHKTYDVNTDGEITTVAPAKFRVIPHALKVYAPAPYSPLL